MKIVFFGSSEFAVPALQALSDKEDVALVVTQPDRKQGRSLKFDSTPVKKLAEKKSIEVFQPANVNDRDSMEHLKRFNAELFVVVSFGQILKRELLDMPKISLNVHASLLPKYRGAAPINWAIANGEKQTGITIIRMNEKMDEGDIVLKEIVPIAVDEDAVTLLDKLSRKGAEVLLKAVDLNKKGLASFEKQVASEATYAPKLKKEDGLIDWNWSAEKIYNRIRAFVPWPGCFTHWDNKILKIWQAKPGELPCHTEREVGAVIECSDKGILVVTGNKSALEIEELQIAGKRRMKASEFIAGCRKMKPGAKL